jgi:hypothetical protein
MIVLLNAPLKLSATLMLLMEPMLVVVVVDVVMSHLLDVVEDVDVGVVAKVAETLMATPIIMIMERGATLLEFPFKLGKSYLMMLSL